MVRPGFPENNIAEDQNIARFRYIVDYSWKLGYIEVRDLADHASLNYVRAFTVRFHFRDPADIKEGDH